YIVLVLGLSASFIMFYTLCYTLASVTRGKTYLAIALALYILFAFLWTFIQFAIALALNIPLMGKEFTELGHRLNHINPINYIDVVQYFIKLKYDLTQEISVANPYISIAVPIAWIVVLFIVGYKIFKKIDL
ncbi:MAG: ABC transporter permease subunit, partial [Ignisphaera sp.]